MKTATPFDTIAAVSTPPGEGGIGIVRLSGDRAFEIVGCVFTPHRRPDDSRMRSFTMRLGYIRNGESTIDEVLVSYMKAPHTYTREDVVEINCHGGAVAVNEVLRLVLGRGARPAEPGEFTKRAFMNGRIDLAQAEAVLDIVRSRTSAALGTAVRQLSGELSSKVTSVSDTLKRSLVELEANIDFAEEEDVSRVRPRELETRMEGAGRRLQELIETYDTGRAMKEGVLTALAGKTNVGKSSILNAFVRFDRAIVTPIPGTTRDVIEEELNVKGIPFILADTAGVAESDDVVEREGVKRSLNTMERADLVILVFDGNGRIDETDRSLIRRVKNRPFIPVVNKSDLPLRIDVTELEKEAGGGERIVFTSARTGAGIAELEERMSALVSGGKSGGDHSLLVTNARHFSLLTAASGELAHALETLREGGGAELIAYDVRSALDTLGEITGEVSSSDILEEIFGNFCIGK